MVTTHNDMITPEQAEHLHFDVFEAQRKSYRKLLPETVFGAASGLPRTKTDTSALRAFASWLLQVSTPDSPSVVAYILTHPSEAVEFLHVVDRVVGVSYSRPTATVPKCETYPFALLAEHVLENPRA